MGKSTRPSLTPKPQALSDVEILKSAQLDQISLNQCISALSEELKAHLPLTGPIGWAELVETTYRHKGSLNISQASWGQACSTLGRSGAAICIILTERARRRANKPVKKPAAYFSAMINRAKTGELKLHKSLCAALKEEKI